MISVGFRRFDVEAADFPIAVTASTDAGALPILAEVAFEFQDVTTGGVTTRTAAFQNNGDQTATLAIPAPPVPCNIIFAVQVRFPASNPVDKPLKLTFVTPDNQKALDKIFPDDVPIVFGNFVMHFR